MDIMGLIVCLLIGAVPSTLILTLVVWIIDGNAFREFGLGTILIRGFCLNLGTTLIWAAFGFVALATGILALGFIGMICALSFWFVGLMNGQWGFGMSGWNAFMASVCLLVISLGIQALLGVG